MKIKLLYCLMLCSLSLFAQDKLHITGRIEGISNETKLILESNFQKKEFQLKEGVIDVEIELNTAPSLVYIMVEHEDDYKYTTFFVGNETVTINGTIDDFPNNIKAINSKYDDLRYREYLMTKSLNNRIEDLSTEAREMVSKGIARDSVYKIYMNSDEPLGKITKVMKEIDQSTFDFVKENINTDYGRYLLRYSMNQFSIEQFKALLTLVDPKYTETVEVKFIQAIVDSEPLVVGQMYYNFKAEDINQKAIVFSDYFKGKYVLLDFSTFHCSFCKEAVPKTVKLIEAFKSRLTYVTYYVDHDVDGVKEYYKLKENKGNLIWNIEGRLASIIAKYRQNATPRYLLFNPEGKLVKDFIGFQDDFEQQLNELMKK